MVIPPFAVGVPLTVTSPLTATFVFSLPLLGLWALAVLWYVLPFWTFELFSLNLIGAVRSKLWRFTEHQFGFGGVFLKILLITKGTELQGLC